MKTDGAAVDVLLTDIAMPGLTGPQLVQMARRFLRQLTVLFISGFIDEQQQRAMPRNSRLLCKPFTPAKLIAFVAGEEREGSAQRSRAATESAQTGY
ncbi:MAG: CheY-like chemotaxis protein [Planctomycetota bacterium]